MMNKLSVLRNKIESGKFPQEFPEFGGANLIITSDQNRRFHEGDVVVYSIHAPALSWLVTELKNIYSSSGENVLVRMHSECITGEAFGSKKCECGPQLDYALDAIASDPEGGVVIYLRGQEGRGIGLLNKLKAYALQDQGMDTVEANLALGLPSEAREYGAAVSILRDLGIKTVRLMSNNPAKIDALEMAGISVTEYVPIIVGQEDENAGYLETKRDKMGHILPEAEAHEL